MKERLPPAPVLLLALLVPLASLITTWQGYHFQKPPERVFMGFRYMAGDHYQYAAFMREARDGVGLLMYNPFTSDSQRGVFVLPYFWALGVMSRLTGGEVVPWWNVTKVVGGFLYIVAFWYFSGVFFQKPRQRLVATGLFSLAGGIDWIVTALRVAGVPRLEPLEYPYDYFWNWSTFGTLQVPNWIWPALFLLVACHLTIARAPGRQLLVFLLMPLVWFVHAYSGMVAYLAFGLLPIVPLVTNAPWRRPMPWDRFKENLRAATPALLSFLVVALYLIWARSDPVFRANSERGFSWTSRFAIWWYPLSYGLLLPLAWFGFKGILRQRTMRNDVILSWLAAAVMLSLNPFYAGVKFQYLVFPPLAILAARGLFYLEENHEFFRRAARSKSIVAVFSLLLCMNAAVSLVKDYSKARTDRDIYMPAAEIEAMRWLESQPEGIVLSTYRAGNRIPWLSGKRVYLGHWFMTPDPLTRVKDAAAFFNPGIPLGFKEEILLRSGAQYVFEGPEEAAFGFDPAGLPLTPIHRTDGYTVYRVDPRR
jgi:hypothetical protein